MNADSFNDWIDLQKNEVNPAAKKGGVSERLVLQTLAGPGFEILSSRPFPKYAEYDGQAAQVKALGPELAARLGTRFAKASTASGPISSNRSTS